MANKIIIGIVIGLVIGLVLGIAISAVIKLPTKTGTGTNNQVTVSGTVTPAPYDTVTTLYFQNLNGTFETSTPVVNGQYSVLLLGGQSYNVFDYQPYSSTSESDYQPFYLPLGVTTFTQNIVPST
jgi:hypothetical protein